MKKYSELSAGIFLLIAVVLFAASIWLIGQERKIFSHQVEYYTTFRDVKGLAVGAPVRLGGITIGRVSKIVFPKDLKDPNIEITLYVDAAYTGRIRRDSEVSIETQGLLGDKFLSLSTGASTELTPVGSTLAHREAADVSDILEKAGTIVNTTVEISENINGFIKEFRAKTLDDFTHAAKNIADITEQIQTGTGLVHRLVYSDDGNDILRNVQSTTDRLNKIVGEIEGGRGALHALVYDKRGRESVRAITAAARNLAALTGRLNEVTTEIKTGKGLAHEIIYTSPKKSLDDTLQKLNDTAANLEKASAALAQGSGTLGALLIDSQLYDNLVEVTDGAKRSFILREAITSSMGK